MRCAAHLQTRTRTHRTRTPHAHAHFTARASHALPSCHSGPVMLTLFHHTTFPTTSPHTHTQTHTQEKAEGKLYSGCILLDLTSRSTPHIPAHTCPLAAYLHTAPPPSCRWRPPHGRKARRTTCRLRAVAPGHGPGITGAEDGRTTGQLNSERRAVPFILNEHCQYRLRITHHAPVIVEGIVSSHVCSIIKFSLRL